jgi:lysophospholipid acyltransferase (LPLAT)-like uncharacterized protein
LHGGAITVKPIKTILQSDMLRRVVCWLGAGYIWLVHLTGRWRVVGGDIPARFWEQGKPFILCFWYGRLLLMPYCWNRRHNIHMLISQHRDGQLSANTVGHFGIQWAAGASSRGGAAALRNMVKVLENGEWVGITPDGPRRPRMRASDGIVSVARLSGVPIIPATCSVNRGRILTSWDRFLVAWPFGRSVIVWGEPIYVAHNADADAVEAARCQIEDELNRITREADQLTGRNPLEPATIDEVAEGNPVQ